MSDDSVPPLGQRLGASLSFFFLTTIGTITAINTLSFIVSVHRFLVFFSPKLCALLFDRPNIHFVLIIPWISGFLVDSGHNFIGNCFKTYNHITFNFWYDCTANTTSAGLIQRQFTPIFVNALPLFSLVLYFTVYLKMRRDQREVMPLHRRVVAMEKGRRERSFLIQALIICLSLASESLLFHLVPYLAQQNIIDWYWVSLLLGWMIIMVASLNPIIYIVFNQTIRGLAFEFLGIRKKNNAQTMVNIVSAFPQKTRALDPSVATKQKVLVINAFKR